LGIYKGRPAAHDHRDGELLCMGAVSLRILPERYLRNPAMAEAAAVPDNLGPYRFDRRLGAGGMGEVFLAYDRRLDRRVAIKRLRSDLDSASARERLHREARAAARLSHPAIVQVYDLVETGAGDWIVMELVDGPRLADMTAHGPLPLPQALAYGRQIAEGLAAAHALGLVHRDLKAENVLIAQAGRATAKILDFGLVRNLRADGSEESLTRTGTVLGTIRTMAPEQVRGLDAGPPADLFSLGVLLYEMAAGRSPFQGSTAAETIHRILGESPAPLPSEVPGELAALIGQLLQKVPELRPPSAGAVALRLERLSASLSGAAGEPGAAGAETERTALPPRVDRDSWSFRDIRQPPARLAAGAALLAAVVVATVALGRLSPEDERAPAPRPSAARPYPAAAPPLSTTEVMALETEAWAALDRYDLPGHTSRAIALFQRLVENDLESAGAHAGLARAYWRKLGEEGGDAMWRDQALAVARRAVELDGTLPSARVSLGFVLLKAGRHDEARAELEQTRALDPRNADAWRGLAEIHQALGEPALAEEAFRRAIALRPTDRAFHDLLGTLYFNGGRLEEAEAEFRRSVELAPDGVQGLRNLAGILIARGRLPEAAALLQRALRITPTPTLYGNLGTVYFYQGLYPAAAAAYEKALALPAGPHRYALWGNLGDAWRQIPHRRNQAPEAFRQAILLLAPEVEREPRSARLRSQLALHLAKAGQADAARREIARIETTEGRSLFRQALACEVLGDREQALGFLQKAFDQGFPPSEAGREPELLALRSDARYQRLLAGLSR
jgi:eukaryotic-like serine/threonine-protein kinase